MKKRIGAVITTGGHAYEMLHILKISKLEYTSIHIHPYKFPNKPIRLIDIVYHLKSCLNFKYDIIICNGPGTCVLYCIIMFLLGKRIIYIESIARKTTLSLSGKILEYISWKFIVQSKQLIRKDRIYYNFFCQ